LQTECVCFVCQLILCYFVLRIRHILRERQKYHPSVYLVGPTSQPLNPTPIPIRCMHLRTYAPTHLRTYAPTHLRTYAPTDLRTYAPAHLRTYAPTHLRTYQRRYTLTRLRTYAPPFPSFSIKLVFTVISHCWVILISLIHYGTYSQDGVGSPDALHVSSVRITGLG
jgi:hypothetical protein